MEESKSDVGSGGKMVEQLLKPQNETNENNDGKIGPHWKDLNFLKRNAANTGLHQRDGRPAKRLCTVPPPPPPQSISGSELAADDGNLHCNGDKKKSFPLFFEIIPG